MATQEQRKHLAPRSEALAQALIVSFLKRANQLTAKEKLSDTERKELRHIREVYRALDGRGRNV